MRRAISVLAVLSAIYLLVLLSGCDSGSGKRLAALEKTAAEEKARVNELEWKTASTSMSAKLEAGDSGYSRIDTPVGMFFTYLKRAEKYNDGYNLLICIGNPSNMTVHGGQMQVTWGEGPDKTKTYTFTQRLEPGQWNEVSAFISPATDKDIKSMTMSLNLSNISLLGNKD